MNGESGANEKNNKQIWNHWLQEQDGRRNRLIIQEREISVFISKEIKWSFLHRIHGGK